ncbi:unnamed protein product, partial [Effrenium voratum]
GPGARPEWLKIGRTVAALLFFLPMPLAAVTELSDAESDAEPKLKSKGAKKQRAPTLMKKIGGKQKVAKKKKKKLTKTQSKKVVSPTVLAKLITVRSLGVAKTVMEKTAKLPHHGYIGKAIHAVTVPLKRTPPLNLKVVCRQKPGKNKKGADKFTGSRRFKAWSTIRCFSATTTVTRSSVSKRGISDLANQIANSTSYKQAIRARGEKPGAYLSVGAAEWFSGLPLGWSSPHAGAVDKDVVQNMFPDRGVQKLPCVSLFTGIGGWLEPVEMVERDPHCRAVLTARQAEGNLPCCHLCEDVVGYVPTWRARTAVALTAGFPCQGVSQAGHQEGMRDRRSALVKCVFDVWDKLPRARVAVMENVTALLSKSDGCRDIFNFILQESQKRGLILHWTSLKLTNLGLPAGRSRTFLVAARPGDDALFQDPVELDHWIKNSPWNKLNSIPEHLWLAKTRSEEDECRIHSMGNLVVPQQACCAASILSHIIALH